jgi:hypothetical protein
VSYKTFIEQVNINQNRLDSRYISHFGSDSLFDKVARILCQNDIISKKEFAESVAVVKILQRFIKTDNRIHVYDICAGHGLTGILLTILSAGIEKTSIVDLKKPQSHDKMMNSLSKLIPELPEKIEFIQQNFEQISYKQNAFLIGVHACATRTDHIMELGFKTSARIALLPCCYKKTILPHNYKKFLPYYTLKDTVDFYRIQKAYARNYQVYLRNIHEKITPMNKLFILFPESF